MGDVLVTQLNTSALTALKDKKPTRKKVWEPLRLSSLHPGTYLAADPSLTAFGLVLFEVAPEQRYAVHMAEVFKTEQGDVGGHEDTLTRALRMESQILVWLRTWVVDHDWGRIHPVHEAPPIGGLKHSKFEISLLTGLAFRSALKQAFAHQGSLGTQRQVIGLLPMVRRQDHARLICGDPNADKKVHHGALKEHFDAIRGADELITNEAKRDALSVSIFAAWREAQQWKKNGGQ